MSNSGDGRRLLLWLLICVALGAFIWWRAVRAPRAAAPATVAPVPVTVSDASVADASAVDAGVPDAMRIETPEDLARVLEQSMYVRAISTDGTRALLGNLANNGRPERFQVVEIDSGAVEADMTVDNRNLETIDRVRALLAPFPLGAGGDIATSPDGKHGAFNDGDPLEIIWNGALGPSVTPAAYMPVFTPDSSLLLFSGYDHHDRATDSGVYALHALAVGARKPTKVAGTDGYDGEWATDGTALVIETFMPGTGYCVHRVPFARPLRVTTTRCLEVMEREHAIGLSPRGSHVGWVTGEVGHRRLRVMRLDTGSIVTDIAERPENGIIIEVSDTGRALFDGNLFEPGATAPKAIVSPLFHCTFRSDTELVCLDVSTLSRVKL